MNIIAILMWIALIVATLITCFALNVAEQFKRKVYIVGIFGLFLIAIFVAAAALVYIRPEDKTWVKEYQVTSVIKSQQELGLSKHKGYLIELKKHKSIFLDSMKNHSNDELYVLSGSAKATQKIQSTVKIEKIQVYSYDKWVPFKFNSVIKTRYIAKILKNDMP